MISPSRITAMRSAIVDGDIAKVKLLLKAGVPASGSVDGMPFITLAATLSKEEVFELLVSHGASLSTPELLEWAVDGDGGRLQPSILIVMKILTESEHDKETLTKSLRAACCGGNVEVVKALIKKGADLDGVDLEFKDFPLSNAILNGHADIVDALLTAGADPSQRVQDVDDEGDLTGTSSSLSDFAIRSGHHEIAKKIKLSKS